MNWFRFGGRGGPGPDERAILDFQDLWSSGEPSIEAFWRKLGPGRSLTLLSALAKVELKARFGRGERPRAADVLDRFPELTEDSDRVISLVYEEFCLLEENGEDPDSAEFCRAYSRWRDSLRSQLGYHREFSQALGSPPPSVAYPKPGEKFASYLLRSVLGKGGAGHVYLAIDEDLGRRKVALKISASVGLEPSILANLDHPNIVPIHSMTEPNEEGLVGFCMPYRPGITLEDLIRRLGRGKPGRQASLIWKALTPAGEWSVGRDADDRPGWANFPIGGSFQAAVAWLGASLADAVGYLHENKVIHRDIKPANILLADREGPQLLDFHLARAPNEPGHAQAALNGGTLPYMAPEQLRAFLDPERWEDVTAAADIYALGLVLREMVTGQGPDLPDDRLPPPRAISGLLDRRLEAPVPVAEINPGISPSLAAILDKCLAPHVADRFGSARELAVDLRCFLERKPLRFAPNPSRIERFANLLYRHRKAIAGSLIVLLIFFTGSPASPFRPRFPDRWGVRSAISDLDSVDHDRNLRAWATFERLRKDEPDSAYPPLYLALASKKLGDAISADSLMKESATCADFDEALDRALVDYPRSMTLLAAKAARLMAGDHSEQAEGYLKKILSVEPGHLFANVAYAKIERERGSPDEAVAYFRAAIESAEKKGRGNESRILTWRKAIVPLLYDAAQSKWRDGEHPAEIDRAEALLREMPAELDTIEREGGESRDAPGMDKLEFYLPYYRAHLESGLGVIDHRRGKAASADAHFATARNYLLEARAAIAPNDQIAPKMYKAVDDRLSGLGQGREP